MPCTRRNGKCPLQRELLAPVSEVKSKHTCLGACGWRANPAVAAAPRDTQLPPSSAQAPHPTPAGPCPSPGLWLPCEALASFRLLVGGKGSDHKQLSPELEGVGASGVCLLKPAAPLKG